MIADQPVVSRHSLAEEQRPAQQQGQVGFRVLARAFSRGTFWHFLALISKKSSSLALVFLTRGPGSPGKPSNGKQRKMCRNVAGTRTGASRRRATGPARRRPPRRARDSLSNCTAACIRLQNIHGSSRCFTALLPPAQSPGSNPGIICDDLGRFDNKADGENWRIIPDPKVRAIEAIAMSGARTK